MTEKSVRAALKKNPRAGTVTGSACVLSPGPKTLSPILAGEAVELHFVI